MIIFSSGARALVEIISVRAIKVSSQSRKFEFNVFSIIHSNGHNFDVVERFQENKVFQTAQTTNNILRSNTR